MFEKYALALNELFEHYAQGPYGGSRQKLIALGSQNERRGLIRLTLDYDICPAFLSKREVKKIHTGVCHMNGTTQGLDYTGLLQVIGLMSIEALSKPSFQHLYPSNQAKVTVILE